MRKEIHPQVAALVLILAVLIVAGAFYIFLNPFRSIPHPTPNTRAHPAGPAIPPPLPANVIRHGPINQNK